MAQRKLTKDERIEAAKRGDGNYRATARARSVYPPALMHRCQMDGCDNLFRPDRMPHVLVDDEWVDEICPQCAAELAGISLS